MSNDARVRDSPALAVFAQIVNGPTGTMRAVELAGRGITAEALWTCPAGWTASTRSFGR